MTQITAPWTEDQVESLNQYQESGVMHPFTCGHGSHDLHATKEGWVCTICEKEGRTYTQNWCHTFMADWSWKNW